MPREDEPIDLTDYPSIWNGHRAWNENHLRHHVAAEAADDEYWRVLNGGGTAPSDSVYASQQAQIARLTTALKAAEAELSRLSNVAGEAIGTHPDLRSTDCVDVLATHAESLCKNLAEARAALSAAQPKPATSTCRCGHSINDHTVSLCILCGCIQYERQGLIAADIRALPLPDAPEPQPAQPNTIDD